MISKMRSWERDFRNENCIFMPNLALTTIPDGHLPNTGIIEVLSQNNDFTWRRVNEASIWNRGEAC